MANTEADADSYKWNELLSLHKYLSTAFPGCMLMPCRKNTKIPLYKHKDGQYTNDRFMANGLNQCVENGCLLILTRDLIVIDIDEFPWVEKIEEMFPVFKETVICDTRKGRHYYFRRTPKCDEVGLLDGARTLKEQNENGKTYTLPIDIKTIASTGTGGVVSIPPSSNKTWYRKLGGDGIEVLNMPDAFIDFYSSRYTNKKANNKKISNKKNTTNDTTKTTNPQKYSNSASSSTRVTVSRDEIQELVNVLNKCRADDYTDWIQLGWCLHNIDTSLFDVWIKFSTYSDKFDQGECEEKWASMRSEGLSIGTLHMWAQNDNPEMYKAKVNDGLIKRIQQPFKIIINQKYVSISNGLDIIGIHEADEVPHIQEVIQDTNKLSYFLFFDLNRDLDTIIDHYITQDYEYHCNVLFQKFIKIFTGFIKEIYGMDIDLVEGKNIHAKYTPLDTKNPKLSIHVKINIKCNMELIKSVVRNLDKYMSSNKYLADQDKSYFFYHTLIRGRKMYVPLIDQSIYSKFKSISILSSTHTLPLANSSEDFKDHLVVCYPDILQTQDIIPLELPIVDAAISADFSQEKQITLSNAEIVYTSTSQEDTLQFTQSPLTTHVIKSDIQPTIPMTHLLEVEKLMMTSTEIQELINPTKSFSFKYTKFITPTSVAFTIDKQSNHFCPYSQARHNDDTSYLEYDYTRNIIHYKCSNPGCEEKHKILFRMVNNYDTLDRLVHMSNKLTLHCKEDVIDWNEKYNEPSMRAYPLSPITCIRAGMGLGKTKTLTEEFIAKQCADSHTKCLVITYQVLLSKKYHNMLKPYGFVNYTDFKDMYIENNKVIVCLDSICRVRIDYFDYVFIDEVLSVLLHFNSNLMKRVAAVSAKFQLCLTKAKYIYILDAAVDNTIVYNFVEYLANKKGVVPYWINNTFKRSSNRYCIAYINKNRSPKLQNTLKNSVIQKVVDLLSDNKKVVVSSSTKAFTEELYAYIVNNLEPKQIMIYNSEANKDLIYQHALNPNEIWNKYDLLIYSPSVSAGLSFETLHFDQLVCYIENSYFTPTVDLVLQQMFRVRQLVDGCMNLYINDCVDISHGENPISETEVEDWLDHNIEVLQNYFPKDSLSFESYIFCDSNRIAYDKSLLSYEILKGIVINKNKSLLHFTDTILNTLRNDYNIECEVNYYEPSDDVLIKALKMYEEVKKCKASGEQPIPFSENLVVDDCMYTDLCLRQQRHHALDRYEKLQKWVYEARNLWGVDRIDVDEEFFDEYIGQYEPNKVKKVFDMFYKALRLKDMVQNSLEENTQNMSLKLQCIIKEVDYNIDIYESKATKYYMQLIQGQKLLNALGVDTNKFKDNTSVEMQKNDIKIKIQKYADEMTVEDFTDIRKIFNLSGANYECLAKLQKGEEKERSRNQQALIKALALKAFGMEYETTKDGSKHKESENYLNDTKAFIIDHYHNFVLKYNPCNVKITSYSFISDDD